MRQDDLPDGNILGSEKLWELGNEKMWGILHLWRAPSWEEITPAEAKEIALIKQPRPRVRSDPTVSARS